MKKQLVVARFRENLDWLSNVNFPTAVYNKSGLKEKDWINVPNVGREAHTYLYHIIKNYDNLAETTIFIQGNPFTHSAGRNRQFFIDLMNGNFDKDTNLRLWHRFRTSWPLVKEELSGDFFFLSGYKGLCNKEGMPHHPKLPVGVYYKELFGHDLPHNRVLFGLGALFAVKDHLIRSKPKKFYEHVISIITNVYTPHQTDDVIALAEAAVEINAQCMERLWYCLFTDPFNPGVLHK